MIEMDDVRCPEMDKDGHCQQIDGVWGVCIKEVCGVTCEIYEHYLEELQGELTRE